jgi:hypothetical protein
MQMPSLSRQFNLNSTLRLDLAGQKFVSTRPLFLFTRWAGTPELRLRSIAGAPVATRPRSWLKIHFGNLPNLHSRFPKPLDS